MNAATAGVATEVDQDVQFVLQHPLGERCIVQFHNIDPVLLLIAYRKPSVLAV